MYYAVISLLMVVLPFASVALEHHVHVDVPVLELVAKWYVFWAVGWRIFLAGLRQIFQPRYTAEQVLGIKGDEVLMVVRELGIANTALSLVALASLFVPGWLWASALCGGVFYAMAGVNHALRRHRTKLENVAMVSDLFAAVVLGCVGAFR